MSNPVCFEVPSTHEITVNGRKLIGSAQARKKEGVLQHGSLPLSGDLARICQALVFEDEEAREVASHRLMERATTVETALGRAVGWETAAQAFVHAFETQLDTAMTGEEALAKLKGNDYSLILLDLKMPGMDGMQVLHRIREVRPEVRVIVITAYGTVE